MFFNRLLIIFLLFFYGCSSFHHVPPDSGFTSTFSKLDEILKNKKLVIGTTGDYRPFSYYDESGQLNGIDIELGKNLAASLGVEVEWVKITWPTLMEDYRLGKFDIAMSGISKNLERQKEAFFSTNYDTSGKTPIARCVDKSKFTDLVKIDRPEVKIVVNPGGTNQKFLAKNIKKAQVVVFPDNQKIFYEIINKNSDVMITDSIEADLQSHLHPELCRTMPNKTFDQFDKAVMLGRDPALKAYLDLWLEQLKINGQLEKIKTKYLK